MARFKFGICSWCIPTDVVAACGVAAQIGLDGMEVDIGKIEEGLPLSKRENQESLKAAASAAGIALPTIAANTLCNHGMSKKNEVETAREVLSTLVKTAVALDIGLLQLPSFIDGFITNEEEMVQTAANLKFVCELAQDAGLLVGSENALSAEENYRLFDLVGASNLRFYFDTSNPYAFSGLDTVPMISRMADRIIEHHVKDQAKLDGSDKFSIVPLGTGESSFAACAGEIVKSGYEGWIHLENSYPVTETSSIDDSITALGRDVETMKKAFVNV